MLTCHLRIPLLSSLLLASAGCSVPIDTGLGAPKPASAAQRQAAATAQQPAGTTEASAQAGARAYEEGDFDGGRQNLEKAERGASTADERLDLADTMASIAATQARRGDHGESLQLNQRVLHLRQEVYGESHPEIAETLSFLAASYYQLQRYDESEAAFQRALEVRKRELGPENRLTALSMNNLAFFYAGRERFAEAEPLFKDSIRILSTSPEATAGEKARALDNYAAMLLDAGRADDAARIQQRSTELRTERNRLEDILRTTK